MAFTLYTGSPNGPVFPYVADASTSFTSGSLAYRDTTTGEIKEATTTVGDATNVEGIVRRTFTSEATNPEVDLEVIIPGQFYVADCTNVTAADQLNKAHLLTDARTVNNTSSHSTDINAIFVALRISGEASDKKLIGYIVKLGQVTA